METNEKYTLLEDDFVVAKYLDAGSLRLKDKKLYRLKALKDFGDVSAGDLGGYIEPSVYLSPYDNCWVYKNARASGKVKILDDAFITDNALVLGDVYLAGRSEVCGDSYIYGYTAIRISGSVYIKDNATVICKGDDGICLEGLTVLRDFMHIESCGVYKQSPLYLKEFNTNITLNANGNLYMFDRLYPIDKWYYISNHRMYELRAFDTDDIIKFQNFLAFIEAIINS